MDDKSQPPASAKDQIIQPMDEVLAAVKLNDFLQQRCSMISITGDPTQIDRTIDLATKTDLEKKIQRFALPADKDTTFTDVVQVVENHYKRTQRPIPETKPIADGPIDPTDHLANMFMDLGFNQNEIGVVHRGIAIENIDSLQPLDLGKLLQAVEKFKLKKIKRRQDLGPSKDDNDTTIVLVSNSPLQELWNKAKPKIAPLDAFKLPQINVDFTPKIQV